MKTFLEGVNFLLFKSANFDKFFATGTKTGPGSLNPIVTISVLNVLEDSSKTIMGIAMMS